MKRGEGMDGRHLSWGMGYVGVCMGVAEKSWGHKIRGGAEGGGGDGGADFFLILNLGFKFSFLINNN